MYSFWIRYFLSVILILGYSKGELVKNKSHMGTVNETLPT